MDPILLGASCQQHREAANRACCVCGALGYGVPAYYYPTRIGHAECIERAVNAAIHRFITGLAELAVDRVLRTEHGYSDADISHVRARRSAHAATRKPETEFPWVLSVERFVLPEHDIEGEIPSGRTRRLRVRIERHTTMLGHGRSQATAVVRQIASRDEPAGANEDRGKHPAAGNVRRPTKKPKDEDRE